MAGATRFRNAALIYNPLAGRRRDRRLRDLARAVDLLAGYGLSVTLVATPGPGGATELARYARICRVARVMQPYLDAIA